MESFIPLKQSFNIYSGIALCHISNGAFKFTQSWIKLHQHFTGCAIRDLFQDRDRFDHKSPTEDVMFACQYGLAWTEHKVPGAEVQNRHFGFVGRQILLSNKDHEKQDWKISQSERLFCRTIRDQTRHSISQISQLPIACFGAHEWIFGPTTLENTSGISVFPKHNTWASRFM